MAKTLVDQAVVKNQFREAYAMIALRRNSFVEPATVKRMGYEVKWNESKIEHINERRPNSAIV